jgi:hypothetical protein
VSEVLPYGKVVAAFYNVSAFLVVNKTRLGMSAEADFVLVLISRYKDCLRRLFRLSWFLLFLLSWLLSAL